MHFGYSDACDNHLQRQVRNSDNAKLLTSGWFRSDRPAPDLSDLFVDMINGELPPEPPDYARPEDGQFVRADSVEFVFPLHLTCVATPSFEGVAFAGAVRSLLIIDDLQMIDRIKFHEKRSVPG